MTLPRDRDLHHGTHPSSLARRSRSSKPDPPEIFLMRGHKIMLDRDLAELSGVDGRPA